MDGGMVAPQICAAGGGGGGNPPEAPGNQDVEERGSADRIVICGRLLSRSLSLSLSRSRSRSRSLSLDDSERDVVLVEVLLMAALMDERGP